MYTVILELPHLNNRYMDEYTRLLQQDINRLVPHNQVRMGFSFMAGAIRSYIQSPSEKEARSIGILALQIQDFNPKAPAN